MRPGFFTLLVVLSRQTLRDLFRERILYNVFFISLLLLFFGYLAALLVYGHQDRVMLHLGLFVNAVSVFIVAAGAGSRLIRNEIDERTAYLILARPLSRNVYFLSKWLGISLFSLLNLLLLFAVLAVTLSFTGGHVSWACVQAMSLIWVEASLLAALALSCSLFLRPGLTMMLVFSFFFIAHNHQQLAFLKEEGKTIRSWLNVLEFFSPDGRLFLMDTRVYYEQALSLMEWLQRLGYGALWTLLFLFMGSALFYRKNV